MRFATGNPGGDATRDRFQAERDRVDALLLEVLRTAGRPLTASEIVFALCGRCPSLPMLKAALKRIVADGRALAGVKPLDIDTRRKDARERFSREAITVGAATTYQLLVTEDPR